MNKKKIFLFFSLIFLVITMNYVLGSVYNIINPDDGYYIISQLQDVYKKDENITINFFVYNESNGDLIDNSSTNCLVFLSDDKGELIVHGDAIYTAEGYWNFVIEAGNFSEIGKYNLGISCTSPIQGGAFVKYFEVTSTGLERFNMIIIMIALTAISYIILFYSKTTGKYVFEFFSGLLLTLIGIYIVASGFEGIRNIVIQGFGVINIGIGFIAILEGSFKLGEKE